MSNFAEVTVIVEGPTEQLFVKSLLGPYLHPKNIFLTPIILDKPGQKGGDVRFARAKNDIGLHLKQRKHTWVTLMVDYYGIGKDWPGLEESKNKTEHRKKAEVFNQATLKEVERLYSDFLRGNRFIPYVSMHELEPEAINDSKQTSPSHRLEKLSSKIKKTTTGIAIAKKIGIDTMRGSCPLFNTWIERLELLT